MKVLLVSNMYPNSENPAYGIFVKRQVDLIESEGNTVDLQVMFKSKNKIQKLFFYLKHYILVFLKAVFKNYDYIYIHYVSLNSPPILLAQTFKKQKLVVNIHGTDIVPKGSIQNKIDKITGKILKLSTLTIVPSSYYKEIVNKKYNIELSKIFVSPSGGIDMGLFYPKKEMNIFNKDNTRYIGYIGRIDNEKGWKDLLKAFTEIVQKPEFNDLKLIMVGSGQETEVRDTIITELQIEEKVIIKEALPQSKLANIFNEIDIFIFPSLRESLGLVGLEAMACGTPVIGSNIGGIRSYLIDNYNGFLSEPGDANSIAVNIEKYFQLTTQEQTKMKLAAIETATKFEQDKIKKEFIEVINEFIS